MCPTLNEITILAYKGAGESGWHAPFRDENGVLREASTFERIGLIMSEGAEALEAFRKTGAVTQVWEGGKETGLESELADIIIRTCELAKFHGFDLDQAVTRKMIYNRTRRDVPARDGGKSI